MGILILFFSCQPFFFFISSWQHIDRWNCFSFEDVILEMVYMIVVNLMNFISRSYLLLYVNSIDYFQAHPLNLLSIKMFVVVLWCIRLASC